MVVVVEAAWRPSRFANFWQGAESLVPASQNDIRTSKKCSEPFNFLCLTLTCASRHNGVHFFDISTIKSVPNLVCLVHFDLEICFVPQRRALFRHLNFQKWSETVNFWKRASRHNGVHFFDISTSKSAPMLKCFATNQWKTQLIATFLPFRAPASSFFSLFLFSDLLSSSLLWLFPSLLFICPYCRKFDF